MNELLKFLNSLDTEARTQFAARCGTTEGYLRKAVSVGQKLGESLCINIERESDRRIVCESLRPDVDWATVRTCECSKGVLA